MKPGPVVFVLAASVEEQRGMPWVRISAVPFQMVFVHFSRHQRDSADLQDLRLYRLWQMLRIFVNPFLLFETSPQKGMACGQILISLPNDQQLSMKGHLNMKSKGLRRQTRTEGREHKG